MSENRQVSVVTTMGKKYTGSIEIPSASFRTTDLFNSANVYWKNPDEKCFENAILMYDARLLVDNSVTYRKFEKIQVKLSEIVYFYDDLQSVGDEREKKRASFMADAGQDDPPRVNIITRMVANSFYDIEGVFHGLFKKKSKDKFIPLTDVEILEVYKRQDRWKKKRIAVPNKFIGIGNGHIESAIIR